LLLGINMQTIRKKKCKQYFFSGVLLLSLSGNIAKGASGKIELGFGYLKGGAVAWNISDARITHVLNVLSGINYSFRFWRVGNFIKAAFPAITDAIVKPYVEHLFRQKPQIIIRSSKDNTEKLSQEMVFSKEVKSKLDDFFSIAKKTNERLRTNNQRIQNLMCSNEARVGNYGDLSSITKEVFEKIAKVKKDNHMPMLKYRSLLLHGPPGTGKTMVAEELARELHRKHGMEWIMVTGSGFFQDGANVKAVNDIFINEVKKNKKNGIVIIIDEADSLFSARKNLRPDSEAYRVVNQLLSFMGTRTNDRMVIMTSNNLIFDNAMDRRIDDAIKIPLPGPGERIETLRLYRKLFSLKSLTGEKIKEIAAHTEGFSQSDLSGIVDKLKIKFVIDDDTDIENNADTIVQEYCEKKQLFVKQQQSRDSDRLEELKGKRYGAGVG